MPEENSNFVVPEEAGETLDPLPPRSLPAADPSGSAAVPRLEGYQISGQLGAGGMGTVWRAWQLSTRREVALKMPNLAGMDSEKSRRRFDREVELTSRLAHPNIARIYDSGVHHGIYFYAMELVEGVPLDTYVRQKQLTRRQILELFRIICDAVQHAHLRGVMHRDLKPSNILVDTAGQPHVLDFGLARTFEVSNDSILSQDGELAGTPLYMSPEQAAGKSDQLDTRTDVYSLGVNLFQLLTGAFPHSAAGGKVGLLRQIVEEEVLRPRRAAPDLDMEIDALLLKALAKDPDHRYPSAGALSDDISAYLRGDPLSARPPTVLYFMKKKARKHRAAITIAGIALTGIIAATSYGSIRVAREKQARMEQNERQKDEAIAALGVEQQLRRSSELRLADSLNSWGDLLGSRAQWDEAQARYLEAKGIGEAHREQPIASNLGLTSSLRSVAPTLETLSNSGSKVVHARFDSTGQKVVMCLQNGSLMNWDLLTGERKEIAQPVEARKLSSDLRVERRTIAVSTDKEPQMSVEFRDISTGALKRVVDIPAERFNQTWMLIWSSNGRYAAQHFARRVRSADFKVPPREFRVPARRPAFWRILDTESGTTIEITEPDQSAAFALAFSPDGTTVWTGNENGAMHQWALPDGKLLRTISLPRQNIRQIKISPNGNGALVQRLPAYDAPSPSLLGNSAVLVDLQTGKEIATLNHYSAARILDFSEDGRGVMTSDQSGTVRVWNAASGELLRCFYGHSKDLEGVSISPDGQTVLSYALDGAMSLWPLDDVDSVTTIAPPIPVTCFAISLNNRLLGTSHTDGSMSVLDLKTGKSLHNINRKGGFGPTDLMFSDDGTSLLGGNDLGDGFRWNLAGGVDRQVSQPAIGISRIRFFSDGKHAISIRDEGCFLIDTGTGKVQNQIGPKPAYSGAISGQFVLSLGNNDLTCFDVLSGTKRTLKMEIHMWTKIAISPNGDVALLGSGDGTLAAFDMNKGNKIWSSRLHSAKFNSITYCADGNLILTGGADGSIKLCDAKNGREVRAVAQESSPITQAVLSNDGQILVYLTDEGKSIRVIDLTRFEQRQKLQPQVTKAREKLLTAPADPEANRTLGEWYAFCGRNDWAKIFLERAGVDNSTLSLHLAHLYLKLGDNQSAHREFKRLLEQAKDPYLITYLKLCDQATGTISKEPATQ